MSFDLQRISESKRPQRQQLTARPIGEKLRILDALRGRELVLRGRSPLEGSVLHDEPVPYRVPES